MKFNEWKLESLIEYLQSCKSSPDFDYHCVTRCSGEIRIYNGERNDGTETDDIFLFGESEGNNGV